jgi:hypothetical protein
MALASAGLFGALPAKAATPNVINCPSGYSCFYPNTNLGGSPWLAPYCGTNATFTVPFYVHSVWNNGRTEVYLFNSGGNGIVPIYAYSRNNNIGWNDHNLAYIPC